MGYAHQTSLDIQIVLSQDKEEEDGSTDVPEYYCGEQISGHLRVITSYDLYFEIVLSFEGHIKTWLGLTTECRFLKETQLIRKDISFRASQRGLHVYHLPFQFTIPYEAVSVHGLIDPQFLKLPPSITPSKKNIYPQKRSPQIRYFIQATRIQSDEMINPYLCRPAPRTVQIIPHIFAAPPLWIPDFPHEYQTCSIRKLQHRFRDKSPGHIRLWGIEPSPINLSTPVPTSTKVSVGLRLVSLSHENVLPVAEGRLVTVRYRLRSHIFISSKKLERVPTLSATRTDPTLTVIEKNTKWQTQEFSHVEWIEESSTSQEHNRDGDIPGGKSWSGSINLLIDVPRAASPTFVSVLSAQRYAIDLRLKVKNLHQGVLSLTLPVQIINSSSGGISTLMEELVPIPNDDDDSCFDVWQRDDQLPSYDIQ